MVTTYIKDVESKCMYISKEGKNESECYIDRFNLQFKTIKSNLLCSCKFLQLLDLQFNNNNLIEMSYPSSHYPRKLSENFVINIVDKYSEK